MDGPFYNKTFEVRINRLQESIWILLRVTLGQNLKAHSSLEKVPLKNKAWYLLLSLLKQIRLSVGISHPQNNLIPNPTLYKRMKIHSQAMVKSAQVRFLQNAREVHKRCSWQRGYLFRPDLLMTTTKKQNFFQKPLKYWRYIRKVCS